jgi:integrase
VAQSKFPPWWLALKMPARLRARLTAQFTIHRDGYQRWHRGAVRAVCGKRTPPAEVEAAWDAKRKLIGAAIDDVPPPIEPDTLTYREALSEFLTAKHARIGSARKPLAERTYHNYVAALNDFGNFRFDGRKIADTAIADIGPRHFSGYAHALPKTLKPASFDTIVTLVSAIFHWAVGMEYIDRFRPGPDFVRPAKQELRDARIALHKSFTPAQVAKLYDAANRTMRCMIALGVCAAFNNSDIAHVTRTVLDLKGGVIDFRRRKTGKVRRVIPLPADVLDLLKSYVRPEPADPAWSDLFFVTEYGNPYARTKSRKGGYMPSNTVSRLFAELMDVAGLPDVKGQNFSGLRTTFRNLAPRGGYDLELKIILGHARGTIDLDHYLEDVGVDRLRHVVNHVWGLVKAEIDKLASTAHQEKALAQQVQPAVRVGGAAHTSTGRSRARRGTSLPPARTHPASP